MKRWLTFAPHVRLYRSMDGPIHLVTGQGRRFSYSAEAFPVLDALRCGVEESTMDAACARAPAVGALLLSLSDRSSLEYAARPPAGAAPWHELPADRRTDCTAGDARATMLALGALYGVTAAAGGVLGAARGAVTAAALLPSAGWLAGGAVVYVFGWILSHEAAHAWAATRCGLGHGRIRLFRDGAWRPRFVLAAGPDGPLAARPKLAVYLAGPALDAILTAALALAVAGCAGSAAAPFLAAWLALHLVFAVGNLWPAGRSDVGRVLALLTADRAGRARALRRALRAAGLLVAGATCWQVLGLILGGLR